MKTILIAIALTGITVSGYGQNTNKCVCRNTTHRKVAVHHKHTTGDISYKSERTYTGNYPKDKNKKHAYKPLLQRESDTRYDKPNTDPDYYLNLGDDGRCRWHCSPGI